MAAVIDDIGAGMNYGHLRRRYPEFCAWNRRVVLNWLFDERYYKKNGDDADESGLRDLPIKAPGY